MPESHNMLESDWREAILRALELPESASRRLLVFLERRCDLSVEVSSRTGISSVRTLQCGLSAGAGPGGTSGDRWIHLTDPAFDDVETLARAALSPTIAFPPGSTGAAPWPQGTIRQSGSGEDFAVDWLESIHREISRQAPTACVQSRWVQFDQRVLVGGREHGITEDRRRGCRIRVQAWTEGVGSATAVSEAVLRPRHHESEELTGPGPEETAGHIAERLRQRRRSREPRPGSRKVVLGPGIGGVLVHEIVGHALEADTAHRGSWLTASEGVVAPEALMVLDDPRRGRAPWRYDDEGHPSGVTPLIGEGRVRSWLCDRTAARKTGRPLTGHGRRSSYREPVRPRMGCTFVAAGRLDPREVVAGVDGIYVRRMEAASVDTASGRATFRVTDADTLAGGRIEMPLKPFLLEVDARKTLAGVDRVGTDLTFDTSVGSCQRDGQSLAISVGAPTIRIGLAMVTV
jgi:predicted Zn-dependent protease